MVENTNYTEELMKRFGKPKFAKKLEKADAAGQVGNMKCLLPDEKIFLNEDFLQIKKSKKGDFVFSHNLKLNKIIGVSKREHRGQIITLKNSFGKISLTSEHLVYAIKLPEHYNYKRNKYKQKLIASWYHAGDLKKGDISLYPIDSYVKDLEELDISLPKLKWDFRSPDLSKKVLLNNNLLRLFGYFLAEGHISEGPSRNYITFALNIKEKDISKDIESIVKDLFNLNVTLKEILEKKGLIVSIYNAQLARNFKKLFGNGASNKKIPDFIMHLPPVKQKDLIYGLWKGDGYVNINRNGPRAEFVTISYQLAQQVKTLLLRQGIIASFYLDKARISRWASHKNSYRLHVGQRESLKKICSILKINYCPESYEQIKSWINRNYVYLPISGVEKREYSGEVFNLEVEDSHSFVSDAFCLHNCGDVMRLELNVDDKTKKIEDIGFQTFGCVAAVASSDVVCELAKGKTIEEAKKLTKDDVIKVLGGMPVIKVHCSLLGIEALEKAIEDYETKQKRR